MEVTENQMISAVWKRLTIKKVPDIVQTAAVESPCCIGVLKKRIFIPEKTYSEDELYYILCHECVHLQNNDFLTKLLIHIICVFYWWNPFVYLLKKDLNQSMEIRCDSVVAEKLSRQQRSDYLSVMLKEFKEKQGMKGSEKDRDIAAYLLEDDSEKLIERFQLVADGKKRSFPKGKILAWLMAGFLLLVSYSFIIQTKYEAPPDEIETDSYAHEVDSGNSYIIKQGDGSYILHTAEQDVPISEESANQLVSDGFYMIEEEMK